MNIQRLLWTVVIATLVAGLSSFAAAQSSQERAQYEAWMESYRKAPLTTRAFNDANGERELLRITAIEGDELPHKPDQLYGPVVRYGCSVSDVGRVSYFYDSSMDHKGSGYPIIPAHALTQLKSILNDLPDDHLRLPPPGRRLVFQVAATGDTLVRVYDRANLPDRILDAIQLSGAGITPWTIHVPAQKTGSAAEFVTAGIHPPSYLAHSPDGTVEVAQGNYEVVVTTKGQPGYRQLREPEVNRHVDSLFGATFTPDGRYLLLQSSRPAIRIFNAKTWEPVRTLPGIPSEAVSYYPDTDWKRGVILSSHGDFGLWDSVTRREIANFGSAEDILDVRFSPDHSLVAVAYRTKSGDSLSFHVRIWSANGSLISELRPSGEIEPLGLSRFGKVAGTLIWLPDSQHLLTIVRPHGFFTDRNLALWNVKSGRYSGDLSGCLTSIDRFAVDVENERVFAECYLSGLLTWDAADAMKRVAQFESTLSPEH